jgi:hypothetical protein
MKKFSILSDDWIPVELVDGSTDVVSLGKAIEASGDIRDIDLPPMTRLATIRLMLATCISTGGDLSELDAERFGLYQGFLQVSGLPEASARSPESILNLVGNNNAALNPDGMAPRASDAKTAQALVAVFLCDLGGLKARLKGVPISGQRPAHVGQIVAMPCGETLKDLLELNVAVAGEPKGWVPWWDRPVSFKETVTGDPVQQLLWPWRRIEVVAPGKIVVAAGQKAPATMEDPWSIGTARMRHYHKGIDLGERVGRFDVTALVMHQSAPLGCWRDNVDTESANVLS